MPSQWSGTRLPFFLAVSITGQFLINAFEHTPNAHCLPTRQQIITVIYRKTGMFPEEMWGPRNSQVSRKTSYKVLLGHISFLGRSRSFRVSPPCPLSWRLTCVDYSKKHPSPDSHLDLAAGEPWRDTRERRAERGLGTYSPDPVPAGSPLAVVSLPWQSSGLSSCCSRRLTLLWPQ